MLKISSKCMYFLQVSIIALMLSACSSLKITDEIVPSDGVQGITISKKSIFDISFDDIQLHNYEPQAFIKFPVAV